MSNKLKKQAAVEIEQLNILLERHRPLVEKVAILEPDAIELSALAAMLHAFYTGVENIFKRITVELNEGMTKSEFWHRQLLDNMVQPGPKRPAVISASLRDVLRGYLDFRHVFRQAYTFDLRWEKMAGLVRECEKTLDQLESELKAFFQSLPSSHPS